MALHSVGDISLRVWMVLRDLLRDKIFDLMEVTE